MKFGYTAQPSLEQRKLKSEDNEMNVMLKKPIFETRNAPCEIYAALQAFERSGNT
jgi:hypothetical protein